MNEVDIFHWLDQAASMGRSLCPDLAKYKLGAIIIDAKTGRKLSYGVNFTKTHPIQARLFEMTGCGSAWIHAEIAAIVRMKELRDSFMFVARYGKTDVLRNARPCEACQLALNETRWLKKVYYSRSPDKWSELK